jgi:calpain-15
LDNGRPVSLFKLRNPWGRGEWQGDWSDQSSKWTPALRAEVDLKTEDDGFFYMDVNDYKRLFASTSICMTNDSNLY